MVCGLRCVETRAIQTINGFKYLINNRGTRCPRRCKKMCLVFRGVPD